MSETPVRLGQREQQIVELLLQGCDNDEIARQLKMARRTVKAHFNRLFLRFGINGGIKRVKLATLLYRRQLWLQTSVTENEYPASESTKSLSSLPRDLRTRKLPTRSELPSTLLKTTYASSTISSDSGTALSLPYGMKLENSSKPQGPDTPESWERALLGLKEN
jgi:hypothetical protein